MGLKEYLRSDAKQSSMRLVLIICTFTACLIAITSIAFNFFLAFGSKPLLDIGQVSFLVGVLLGAATAGNGGQSITEKKENKDQITCNCGCSWVWKP